jgi:hypothetical protein
MVTVRNYGFSFGGTQRTSMAYYWEGITSNFQKFPNSGAVVEASWMGGQQANFSAPLSNLGDRRIDVYSNVKSALRFDSLLIGIFNVIPLFSKRPMIAPIDLIWTVWG